MAKKQPNRLAKLIDHQAFAGSALPQSLSDDMRCYLQATKEVKTILVDCLPEEILNSCLVVGLTAEQLTLSVSSVTAANHIRYLQNAYLQILREQSFTFKQLKQIRIVVTNTSTNYPKNSEQSAGSINALEPHKANNNQALSQNTKRTIAQAAEHVTTDKNLQNAILRLIKD
ncbi:DciA family protein [Psychrobacter jeotgali]|uniref:DciA family protein n=1 Tax=Psychrobacter jeotgali TaxID=179010 RepID=UPI00191985C1|nr:DciA family protein [Psychrobacter jeotgali]